MNCHFYVNESDKKITSETHKKDLDKKTDPSKHVT